METKLIYYLPIQTLYEIEIEIEDFYKYISNDVRKKFDTSDYPENHPSEIKTGINKKVIGTFKDEACGKQITFFVGLRAKLYSYKLDDLNKVKEGKM